jgi:hypothetical protein
MQRTEKCVKKVKFTVGDREGWVDYATFRPLYPKKDPVPIV